ncbi:MAG: WhiB family transcriptional regulator [Pseudonocardiaceae bacterium]
MAVYLGEEVTPTLPGTVVVNTGAVDREGTVRLLSAILADSPRLPGAACRGRHALFDPIRGNEPGFQRQEQRRRTDAARLCAGCPVRAQCSKVTT